MTHARCSVLRWLGLLVLVASAAVGCGGGDDDGGTAGQGGTAGVTAGVTAGTVAGIGAGVGAGTMAGVGAGSMAGTMAGTGAGTTAGTGSSGEALLLTQVTVGEKDACGLDATGAIHCWGDNSLADLVGEPPQDLIGPTKLVLAGTYKQIAAGNGHRCALQSDDTLVCWGDDTWKALGIGLVRTNVFPPEPVAVAGPWKSVSALYRDTCAVHGSGKLYCWGARLFQSDVPTQIGTDTDWSAVATGQVHACALKTGGTVHCWGGNGFGQLGIGSTDPDSADPVQVGTDTDWVEIAVGNIHSCARKSSGAVHCWGQNIDGALGDTTFESRNAPVAATTATNWAALSLSNGSSCAINTDKQLWCWGTLSVPFQPQPYLDSVAPPVQIGSDHSWQSVALGPNHGCAITTDSETYCWGDNDFGGLGDGTTQEHDGLVRVDAL